MQNYSILAHLSCESITARGRGKDCPRGRLRRMWRVKRKEDVEGRGGVRENFCNLSNSGLLSHFCLFVRSKGRGRENVEAGGRGGGERKWVDSRCTLPRLCSCLILHTFTLQPRCEALSGCCKWPCRSTSSS